MKKILSSLLLISCAASAAFADNENYDGQDVRGKTFSWKSLVNSSWVSANASAANSNDSVRFFGSILTNANFNLANLEYANFFNANLTGANFVGANLTHTYFYQATLTNADFTNAIITETRFSFLEQKCIGFTKEQLYSTKSYQDKILTGIKIEDYDLSAWNFSNQNLTDSSFDSAIFNNTNFSNAILTDASFISANLSNAILTNANLTNAILTAADLRGANLTGATRSTLTKNTILENGRIENFSMTSSDDNFSIRKYTPNEGGAMINAKITSNSAISGDATLSLKGGYLDVTNNAALTVSKDSSIKIDYRDDKKSLLYVDSGASLTFDNGAILTVNVTEDFLSGEVYSFSAIKWESDSLITGLSDFVKDETIFLMVNDSIWAGDWDFLIQENSLVISMVIPEPSTYAAIFGILALGFIVIRKRRK